MPHKKEMIRFSSRIRILLFGILFSLLFTTSTVAASPSSPSQTDEVELTGLLLSKKPTKLTYQSGEPLDLTGMSLYAVYSDSSCVDITTRISSSSISGYRSTIGRHEVIIRYSGQTVSFLVDVLPSSVSKLYAKPDSTSSYTLHWDSQEGVTEYEVYAEEKADDTTKSNYIRKEIVTTNSYRVMNAKPSDAVTYKVRARANAGQAGYYYGDFSELVTAAPLPEKVTGVTITNRTNESLLLTWNNLSYASGYEVYRMNAETNSPYELVATVKTHQYLSTSLEAATGYRYQIRALSVADTFAGERSDTISSATNPNTPALDLKKGSELARLSWNLVKKCTGYIIYQSTDAEATYTEYTRVNNLTNLYTVKNLALGQSYSYKIVAYYDWENVTYYGVESTSHSMVMDHISITSTAAKLFKTLKAFKKSAAYKKYTFFKKNAKYKLSYILPGLKETNVGGFSCKNVCHQAIAFTKEYLFISAYDLKDVENSCIYVMNRKTRKYITTLALPINAHVGGLAYDGTNLWVAYGTSAAYIPYTTIRAAINSGDKAPELALAGTCPLKTQASFMTYYKGMLWAGEYNDLSSSKMYSYTISNKKTTPTLTKKNYMSIPSKTQGVTFLSNKYMLISRSCQVSSSYSVYMSQVQAYKPAWNKVSAKGTIKKGKCKKTSIMPPMIEGITTYGKYTYINFESASFSACKRKMDRVIAIPTKKLYKK